MKTVDNRLKGKYVTDVYGNPWNCWQVQVYLDHKRYFIHVENLVRMMKDLEFESYIPPRCSIPRLRIAEKPCRKHVTKSRAKK